MKRTRTDEGSAVVEFALVFPILLLLISAIIDFGRLYFEQADLSGAAREGVRLVALGKTDGDTIASAVNDSTTISNLQVKTENNGSWTTIEDNLAGDTAVSGVTLSSCTAGDPVTVVVNTTFTFWTPLPNLFGVFGGQETIAGRGVMRCGG